MKTYSLLAIYFMSFVFLANYLYDNEKRIIPSFTKKEPPPRLIQLKRNHFQEKTLTSESSDSFQKSKKSEVHLALNYLLGLKINLPKDIKQNHQALNLLHLFTLSGIHLSSFLVTFKFVKKIPRLGFFLYNFLIFLFCLQLQFWPAYYSLKKLALLRIMMIFSHVFFKKNIDIRWAFYLTFSFDYFWGNYSLSPLSFFYSFLFLGIVIHLNHFPLITHPFFFLGGQLLIAFLFHQKVYLISFIFSYLLTALFTLIYPLLTILFWMVPVSFSYHFIIFLVETYYKIMTWTAQLAKASGSYQVQVHHLLIFFMAFWCLSRLRQKRFFTYLVLFLTLLVSPTTTQIMTSPQKIRSFLFPPKVVPLPKKVLKMKKELPYKTILKFPGKSCQKRFIYERWFIRC